MNFTERTSHLSELSKNWKETLDILTHAFQPIVSIHSGATLGFEALLRNTEIAGFPSIGEFFDQAAREKCLFTLDLELRKKAINKFRQIGHSEKLKLFYNIDNRIIEMPDFEIGITRKFVNKYNLNEDNFTFEISEKYDFFNQNKIKNILELYQQQGYSVALDDFGSGYSGLKYFYNFAPDYIKIDRFFINNMPQIDKKKIIVTGIINIAKKLGIKIIAEGIETKEEYLLCRDLGCDYVQGYLIQKPRIDVNSLLPEYDNVKTLNMKEKRRDGTDKAIILKNLKFSQPVNYQTSFIELFDKIKKINELDTIPVVNKHYEPQGVILEEDLRKYVYSMYGKDLLLNKSFGKSISDFIKKYPIMDINDKLENYLEIFSNASENVNFIIITEDGKYKGLLNTRALLQAINEKNLDFARNMNPLTKLAGNTIINDFINESYNNEKITFLIYFDFDNFKPFNDKYGFRRGDRVIMIFADILRSVFDNNSSLIGHIGGDDFFVGVRGETYDKIHDCVLECTERFHTTVKDLYNDQDKRSGYIIAEDRFGEIRKFGLLTVSAFIVEIPKNCAVNMSVVEDITAILKHNAKSSKTIAATTLVCNQMHKH